jgi:hypothetical protein
MRRALIVVLFSFTSGCGLVYQGTIQTVRLSTQPEEAAIVFHGKEAVSPATFTLSRRVHGLEIYSATKAGYHPACRVNDCGPPRWIKVWDSIFAAIPLAIDASFGALGNCDDATLTLEPVRPGDATFTLPSTEEIMANPGICAFPYLYDERFAAQAERIVVSTGDLQRPYEIVGNVDFGKLGFDRTDAGAVALKGFALAWAQRTFSKAPPAEINSLMRKRALREYGARVDALINVNYQSDPANNVFATAVAVHFTETRSHADTASTRMGELEQLRKNGLIDQREYEQKRAEILRGL